MIIIGLGSNIGDRLDFLQQAVDSLGEFIDITRVSPIYEVDALLPENAPTDWDMPFLNMVAGGDTDLEPYTLLESIKQIERKLGRKGGRKRWAPREIDIDIIAHDSQVIKSERLTIPHKELVNRNFFLYPLADIYPDWEHPTAHQTAKELAEALRNNDNAQSIKQTGLAVK